MKFKVFAFTITRAESNDINSEEEGLSDEEEEQKEGGTRIYKMEGDMKENKIEDRL